MRLHHPALLRKEALGGHSFLERSPDQGCARCTLEAYLSSVRDARSSLCLQMESLGLGEECLLRRTRELCDPYGGHLSLQDVSQNRKNRSYRLTYQFDSFAPSNNHTPRL